jgi:hypothetical protein
VILSYICIGMGSIVGMVKADAGKRNNVILLGAFVKQF